MEQEEGADVPPWPELHRQRSSPWKQESQGEGAKDVKPSAGALHTSWKALGFGGAWTWEFEPSSSVSQRTPRLSGPLGHVLDCKLPRGGSSAPCWTPPASLLAPGRLLRIEC